MFDATNINLTATTGLPTSKPFAGIESSSPLYGGAAASPVQLAVGACPDDDAYVIVLLALAVPLWTFITVYLLLLLIHYLRRVQHFTLYDRCTTKNAHFRYDLHIVVGRHSSNYTINESHLILDLLDNQLVSTMTIQVPGPTIYQENQVFVYRHTRPNLRCVTFTIYRKHPVKDVRCIRVAHSCSNPDSRLFVYGLNLYDSTNGEHKFFPISSVVKYRGTQWALNTTFEPKSDTSFTKLGCECYDPFGSSSWPSFIEFEIFLFYMCCSVLCFGHLISVDAILGSLALHVLTVSFIAGTSAIVISFVYLRFAKSHIVDQHYEPTLWLIVRSLLLFCITILCLSFWALATGQMSACKKETIDWAMSSGISFGILVLIFLIAYFFIRRRKIAKDSQILEESDSALMKTNSRASVEFVKEATFGLFQQLRQQPQQTAQLQQLPPTTPPQGAKKTLAQKISKSGGSGTAKPQGTGSGHKRGSSGGRKVSKTRRDAPKAEEETLENAFGNTDSAYMKTKNRNSISQYV